MSNGLGYDPFAVRREQQWRKGSWISPEEFSENLLGYVERYFMSTRHAVRPVFTRQGDSWEDSKSWEYM